MTIAGKSESAYALLSGTTEGKPAPHWKGSTAMSDYDLVIRNGTVATAADLGGKTSRSVTSPTITEGSNSLCKMGYKIAVPNAFT